MADMRWKLHHRAIECMVFCLTRCENNEVTYIRAVKIYLASTLYTNVRTSYHVIHVLDIVTSNEHDIDPCCFVQM